MTGLVVAVMTGCVASEPGSDSLGSAAGDSPDDSSGAGLEMPDFRLPRLVGRSVVPIDSLMSERVDESVAIKGTVAQRVAILEGWLYQVQDDTGKLWVLADHTAPEVGQLATVEGTLRYEAIVVGEIDAGEVYLEAQSYRQEND
ncbi:MAG: hypothetical protein AAFN40_25405 [Cyanobacteria bacterium J06560_6]